MAGDVSEAGKDEQYGPAHELAQKWTAGEILPHQRLTFSPSQLHVLICNTAVKHLVLFSELVRCARFGGSVDFR